MQQKRSHDSGNQSDTPNHPHQGLTRYSAGKQHAELRHHDKDRKKAAERGKRVSGGYRVEISSGVLMGSMQTEPYSCQPDSRLAGSAQCKQGVAE